MRTFVPVWTGSGEVVMIKSEIAAAPVCSVSLYALDGFSVTVFEQPDPAQEKLAVVN
jgi:hypothetical protein